MSKYRTAICCFPDAAEIAICRVCSSRHCGRRGWCLRMQIGRACSTPGEAGQTKESRGLGRHISPYRCFSPCVPVCVVHWMFTSS